jgi:hypothetical protein
MIEMLYYYSCYNDRLEAYGYLLFLGLPSSRCWKLEAAFRSQK